MLIQYTGNKEEVHVGVAIKFNIGEAKELPDDIAIAVLRADNFEEVKVKTNSSCNKKKN